MQLSSRTKGTCFLIFSAFSFAWMNAFVRLAGDLSFIQKSFFRNLIALLVALIMLFKERQPLHCDKKSAGALLLRATMGTVGIFCNFYAIDHLPISDASMLNKMSPFFSVLLAWLLLKERITWKQVCIICGAFIGSLFIIKPTFSNLSLFPSCIGLLGGFGAGFAYTMVRYLGTRHVPKAWIIFLFSAFSCLVALPWLLLHYEPMTWKQDLPQLADSLVLPTLTSTQPRKIFLSMTIHRLFLRHCWAFSCSSKFRMGIVFSVIASLLAWQFVCSFITSGQNRIPPESFYKN